MTTINDRITRLEDAFAEIVPLLKSIDEKVDTVDATLVDLEEKLDGVISTLNQHSIDLKLIKEHLG